MLIQTVRYFLLKDDLLPALEVLNVDTSASRGRSSPGLEVLNVPTQDYEGRISDSKE